SLSATRDVVTQRNLANDQAANGQTSTPHQGCQTGPQSVLSYLRKSFKSGLLLVLHFPKNAPDDIRALLITARQNDGAGGLKPSLLAGLNDLLEFSKVVLNEAAEFLSLFVLPWIVSRQLPKSIDAGGERRA